MTQSKWADYVIIAVRYNSQRTHIEQVRVYEHTGTSLTNLSIQTRQQVVQAIKQAYTYVTATEDRNRSGYWNKGDDVGTVLVNGTEYIRTDGNSKVGDNLGNLPEF